METIKRKGYLTMTEVIVFLIVFTALILAIGTIGLSIAFVARCNALTKEVKDLKSEKGFEKKES